MPATIAAHFRPVRADQENTKHLIGHRDLFEVGVGDGGVHRSEGDRFL